MIKQKAKTIDWHITIKVKASTNGIHRYMLGAGRNRQPTSYVRKWPLVTKSQSHKVVVAQEWPNNVESAIVKYSTDHHLLLEM